MNAKSFLLVLAALSGCSSSGGGECRDGEASCAEDGRLLTVCVAGQWQATDCMAEHGQLCQAGACVDPWRYGSPVFSRCPDEPRATAESLREKAAFFDDIARRLHIHPELKWIAPVDLPCAGTDCTRAGVPQETATVQDVAAWDSGENDGLWSALYLAAQAFRYGATRDPQALATIKLLLAGEVDRMAITWVRGIFTRQLIPPGVPGLTCPTELTAYVPDVEKDDNRWVRVNTAGCVEVVDGGTMAWRATDHCGLSRFAGYCFLDNVSRDEYAGHMLALGALAKLVDDPEVQATVKDLLTQVCDALVDTRLLLQDWDGRPVEHGTFYAMSLDEFPGFNAAMAMDFLKMCAETTDNPKFVDFYDNCLLQKGGTRDCLQRPSETPRPYTEYLSQSGMYVGAGNCSTNWNNISMHFCSLHNLIWFERDPATRQAVQAHLEEIFDPPAGTAKAIRDQNNAWFDFTYAALKQLGPGSTGPAYEAVENGVCMLRQFPTRKHHRAVTCPPDRCQPVCTGRLGEDLSDYARPVTERCIRQFVWWANPYDIRNCEENLRRIEPPTDFLLAYWMGRYYGFIPEDL